MATSDELLDRMNSTVEALQDAQETVIEAVGQISGVRNTAEGADAKANEAQTVANAASALISGHSARTDNPHGVSKTHVGLSNLPNAISDAVNSASSAQLATSKAVKTAYDLADAAKTAAANAQTTANAAKTTAENALPKSGGEITGALHVKNLVSAVTRMLIKSEKTGLTQLPESGLGNVASFILAGSDGIQTGGIMHALDSDGTGYLYIDCMGLSIPRQLYQF